MTHIAATPLDSQRPLIGDLAEAIHIHHEFGYAYYRLQRHNSRIPNSRTVRLSWKDAIMPTTDPRHTYTVEILNPAASPPWTELVTTRANNDEAPLLLASLLLGWTDGMVALPYNWTPCLYICPCCEHEVRADRYALDNDTTPEPGDDEVADADIAGCFVHCIACANGDDEPVPPGERTGRRFHRASGEVIQG